MRGIILLSVEEGAVDSTEIGEIKRPCGDQSRARSYPPFTQVEDQIR